MRPLPPAVLVIFGITGDLAKRKLLPSIYDLAAGGKLSETFEIVGVTRRGTTVDEVINNIRSSVEARGDDCSPEVLNFLAKATQIIKMDITDIDEYTRLKRALDQVEERFGVCLNRIFYLAIPAQMFIPIVKLLGESKLNSGCQHNQAESRLLIEKPIGYDLTSAKELIQTIGECFSEKQTYLIDHYLAKSGVKAITSFRFNDGQRENEWNDQYISHISITASEKISIEGRTIFYEQMGALRDVVQSHLMQILAIVTMDKPNDNSNEATHTVKSSLLNSVQPPAANESLELTVRGQYVGYAEEVNNPNSQVETYAALIVKINNDRWGNVPILLATGKCLAEKRTEVKVKFKQGEEVVFVIDPSQQSEDAYMLVMMAALEGDKSLFASSQEVLASWQIVQPVMDAWSAGRVPLEVYKPGSDGPESFKSLVSKLSKTHET